MAQRRIGCRQAISVSPCEVRDRRRPRRLDRVGKFRGRGIPGRDEGQSRLVRRGRRRRPGDRFEERLRGRFRRAPPRFDIRRNTVVAGRVPIARDVATGFGGTVGEPPSSSCHRTRREPRSGRHPGSVGIRAGAALNRNVLHRGPLARHDQSFPRSGVRCRPQGRKRENPLGRKLVVRRSRFRHERRRGCADQSPCEGAASPDGSAVARAPRPDPAIAQQGRRRGRSGGPRLEHELGPRLCDGESRNRRPPR